MHAYLNSLERHFDESFQALCFEELVRLLEGHADSIEVRRRGGDQPWEARLWVEEYPGTTWPLALYLAEGNSAQAALLGAWAKAKKNTAPLSGAVF